MPRCAIETPRTNKAAAAEGVEAIYADFGLASPRIVWCEGPVALAKLWATSSTAGSGTVGAADVRALFLSSLSRLAAPWQGLRPTDREKPGRDERIAGRMGFAEEHVHALVLERVGSSRQNWLAAWPAGLMRRPTFASSGLSQHQLKSAFGCQPDDVLGLPADAPARVVARLVRNAAWIVPSAESCLLCELPVTLTTDGAGRLHSSGAPALQFGDGFAVHAWKGAIVPAWMIETPHAITLRWIDAEIDPAIRRAMIDIFGIDRFIAAGGASRSISDAAGTLWQRNWTHRGVVIDAWSAFECAGGAYGGRHDHLPRYTWVPSELETPQAALDWIAASGVQAYSQLTAGR